ncbi:MAG: YihY/virulence factor BrkB family protein [Solirubrobacterales bacterium]
MPGADTLKAVWLRVRLAGARALGEMIRDRGHRTAAQMAFFIVLALLPLLLLGVATADVVAGEQAKKDVVDAMLDVVPIAEDQGREKLQSALDEVASGAQLGVFSVLVLLVSASSLMAGARHAINESFDLDVRRGLVARKLLDFGLVPVLSLLLIGGLAVDGLNEVTGTDAEGALRTIVGGVADTMPFVTSFVVFALLYRLLPAKRRKTREIWPGALVGAVLLAVARGTLELYFEQLGNYEAIYGALSGVIALILFAYAGTLTFVYGAEFAAEWARLPSERGGVREAAAEEGIVASVRTHAARDSSRAERREVEAAPGQEPDQDEPQPDDG